MSETQPQGTLEKTITVRISDKLSVVLESASVSLGLRKSDIIRLGLDRGIPAISSSPLTPILPTDMQTSPSIIKDLNHALDILTGDTSHVMKLAAANLLRIISGEILADVAKDRKQEDSIVFSDT